ncbi:CPBP family intramembrane glutamic endopeptidase [Gracilimonas sp.]|uniref:CPBP family intramembrane glutamic endopeptidase n=1 Tax=Gracilimonas sp. TaxID=1974203 RepID=UPI002871BE26|nr:CPBP family intramembrane glutamic endopeptidase [Gracilimonas sp.]
MNENEIQPKEDENSNEFPNLTTGKLLILSVVSANIYVFFSFLIIRYWHEGDLSDVLESSFTFWNQAGIGVGIGCLAAGIIYSAIRWTPINDVLSDFSIFEALSKTKFSLFDRIQISLFAGGGEELLFRGAIQPLLGNTVTSIIFIGIHGYFKFKSPKHILFGGLMFGLSFMLGLLYEHIGLMAAMCAHAVYDLIMLQVVQTYLK